MTLLHACWISQNLASSTIFFSFHREEERQGKDREKGVVRIAIQL